MFRSDFENFQLNTFNGTNYVVQNIGSCSQSLNGAGATFPQAAAASSNAKAAAFNENRAAIFMRDLPERRIELAGLYRLVAVARAALALGRQSGRVDSLSRAPYPRAIDEMT